MLTDLLSPAAYIMVNREALKVFGLNTAVYCSELLTIYSKVCAKKKFVNDEKYFQVDRAYIEKQTSLDIESQLKCDANLSKVNVIKVSSENPDIIYFDQELFASIITCEDIKILDNVSAKVKVNNPKGTKQSQRDRIIIELKQSIECKTYDVLIALKDWIDSVMTDPKKFLSKQQVAAFKNRIDDYCNGDVKKALEIINLATVHQYMDCQWAINLYERGNKAPRPIINNNVNTLRVTEQKKTTAIGEEVF